MHERTHILKEKSKRIEKRKDNCALSCTSGSVSALECRAVL
jgi:hypothetical protein